jgi:hypothetical protein
LHELLPALFLPGQFSSHATVIEILLSAEKLLSMKGLLYLAISFASALFICCNKSSSVTNATLIGKWGLIETLADPGDGSGKWKPVDHPNNDFVVFNRDETMLSNTIGRMMEVKRYQIIDSVTIKFLFDDGNGYNMFYAIKGDTLTIMGGCIEACGSKFIKKTS